MLQQPSGGFGAAQDSESWIDGARSEGGYYARDAASRADLDPPAVDGKVVTGWNGLAIGALARAGARLDEPAWIEAARWAADAVLGANVRPDGRLVRASLDEIASTASATLADYGQLASGLVALAVATGEVAYAVRARDLVLACIDADGAPRVPGGGDPVLAAQGVAAPDAASDGDEPSGLSALADAAVSLWRARRRGGTARRRGADRRPRTRPARSSSLSRTVRCCASRRRSRCRRASSWWSPRSRRDPLVAAARGIPCRRRRDRDRRAGRGVVARGLRAVRGEERCGRSRRPPTTAATSPAGCRSPTLRS